MSPADLLRRFPRAASATAVTTPPQGLSGAVVRRVETPAGPLCLRGSPDVASPNVRHALMRRGRLAGCDYVPEVFGTVTGDTFVVAGGRVWELMSWQPGVADFITNPSPTRLTAAFVALARLHLAWRPDVPRTVPCPALQRRQRALADLDEPDRSRVGAMLAAVPAFAAVQPCVIDVHDEHVLFSGDEVTGIVDYALVAEDTPLVDVARLVGSMAGDDVRMRAAAMDAYSQVATLTDADRRVVDALDRTGRVIARARWDRLARTRPLTAREEGRRLRLSAGDASALRPSQP